MRLRPAAVPGVDPVPAPADGGLLDREQAALDAERAVAAGAEALARAISSLASEVQALADRAATLQQRGQPEAEWLLARFHSHRLECPDLTGLVSQAVAARNQALTARARAAEMARVLLQASTAALEEHRAGLARDAGELDRVEAAEEEARAEEARRAEVARTQMEQRREAEARRAEAARTQMEQRREAEARRAEASRKQMEQCEAEARRAGAAHKQEEEIKMSSRDRRGAPLAEASPRSAEGLAPSPAPAGARSRGPVQPLGKLSRPGPSRRDGARIPLQAQVDLSSDSNLFTGFSTNVSEGGLFVATVNLLPVGTPVDLTFSLPNRTRITVQGEVRWTRELDDRAPDVFPGVGVRFVDLSPEAAEALHRFVSDREPLFYPD